MAAFKSEFEVKRMRCAGLDVHKTMVMAAIIDTDPNTLEPSFKTRKFSTMNDDIMKLKDWLIQNDCHDVCMESTGKYWIPIFDTLEPHMNNTVLTHPKYVRAIKGKKTDKRDAKWIANLFRFDIVKSSFIPPPDIRAMRELSRYKIKLAHMATSEKNRYQNSMTISGIRLDCLLTDSFGKTASSIMQYILTHDKIDEDEVEKLIDKRVKSSHEDILRSIRGCQLLDEQRFKLEHAQSHLDFIENMVAEINAKIDVLSAPYSEQIKNLSSIPGMTEESAKYVIAEVGADMSVFESDKHFVSWCGACPACNESNGKKHSTRIGKGGKYLKPMMVQVALAATNCKKNPYYAIKYNRIAKRRGKKKALMAIVRMMLMSVYHMLRDGKAWKPNDYDKVVNRTDDKKVVLNMDNVMQFLREQGADPETMNLIKEQCARRVA